MQASSFFRNKSLFKRKLLLLIVYTSILLGLTYITWWQSHHIKNSTNYVPIKKIQSDEIPVSKDFIPSEYDKIIDLIAGNLFNQEIPTTLNEKDWENFNNIVKTNWSDYYSQIGQPMMKWSAQEIRIDAEEVFYPFSGPDFSTLYQFYPNANHYVMVAQQKGEHLVNLSSIKSFEVAKTLDVLESAWSSFGHNGFFVTEYLFKYISQNKVKIGPTTLIASFAHLQDFSIRKIVPIEIDEEGQVRELEEDHPWDSVRFFLNKDGHTITVDYLSMDLSNEGLKKAPQNMLFFDSSSKFPVLLKAASHLPQHKNFTLIRDSMLKNSPYIVQDETGLDYKPLKKLYDTSLYGDFEKPYKVFSNFNQELVKAYREQGYKKPLPFRIGYFKNGSYALIVAKRKIF
jgi:hypothetical protein